MNVPKLKLALVFFSLFLALLACSISAVGNTYYEGNRIPDDFPVEEILSFDGEWYQTNTFGEFKVYGRNANRILTKKLGWCEWNRDGANITLNSELYGTLSTTIASSGPVEHSRYFVQNTTTTHFLVVFTNDSTPFYNHATNVWETHLGSTEPTWFPALGFSPSEYPGWYTATGFGNFEIDPIDYHRINLTNIGWIEWSFTGSEDAALGREILIYSETYGFFRTWDHWITAGEVGRYFENQISGEVYYVAMNETSDLAFFNHSSSTWTDSFELPTNDWDELMQIGIEAYQNTQLLAAELEELRLQIITKFFTLPPENFELEYQRAETINNLVEHEFDVYLWVMDRMTETISLLYRDYNGPLSFNEFFMEYRTNATDAFQGIERIRAVAVALTLGYIRVIYALMPERISRFG